MHKSFDQKPLSITKLNDCFRDDAIRFLVHIFNDEQGIPAGLIPIKNSEQMWWCIWNHTSSTEKSIIGTVATWRSDTDVHWHWGRFAVHSDFRGRGLGEQLAVKSFNDLFSADKPDLNKIVINARKATVKLLLKLGGKIAGDQIDFYGLVTPMTLSKRNYLA